MKIEYVVYGVLFISICVSVFAGIKTDELSQQLLAASVIASIIGVIGSMWKLFRYQEEVEDTKKLELKKIKVLEDANKLKETEIGELKEQNKLLKEQNKLSKEQLVSLQFSSYT